MKVDPISTTLNALALAFEAQQVIALRMMRIALGGALAQREMQRMMAEKATTAGLAILGATTALARGKAAETIAGETIGTYRRAVRANRKRLLRR